MSRRPSSECQCSRLQTTAIITVCIVYLSVFTAIHSGRFYKLNTSMRILVVSASGQTTNHDVMATDTVLSLKQEIEDKEGIPVEQQHLHFLQQPMDSNRQFLDYRVQDGSIIRLTHRITKTSAIRMFVYKRGEYKASIIFIQPQHTVLLLKGKIRDILGIPVSLMDLIFFDIILCDYSKLSELNLDPWSSYELIAIPKAEDSFTCEHTGRIGLHLQVL